MELLSDYFGGAGSDGDDSVSSNEESERSDVSQNESDNNDDDSLAGSVVIDEVAAVMNSVDVVDDENSASELRTIREFSCVNKSSKSSCHLHNVNDNPCYSGFTEEFVLELKMNMSSLPDYEKDLIILGKISSTIRNSLMTEKSKRKEQTARQQQRTNYCVEGQRVCRETFKFLHCISQDKLTALLKHYKEFGLTPRYKKSGGRRAADVRLLTHADISRVVAFLVNFAEDHALMLPGRIPGYKRFDIKLLPSNYT